LNPTDPVNDPGGKPLGYSALAIFLVAVIVSFTVLMLLGTWQLYRLAWKEELIVRIETRIGNDPVPLPRSREWNQDFLDNYEYRPVTLRGEFHQPDADNPDYRIFYSYTLLSSPRGAAGGQGYWVMHLFYPDDGGAVYVNRGFVPFDAVGKQAPPPSGPVNLAGLVRRPTLGNLFTPLCDPKASICYARDVEHAAGLAGAGSVGQFYLDLTADFTAPSGLPQAGETRVVFTNNHLQYAFTWFGLGAALLAVAGAFGLSQLRGRRASGVSDIS
jgi:surfeit locus 1 family protein